MEDDIVLRPEQIMMSTWPVEKYEGGCITVAQWSHVFLCDRYMILGFLYVFFSILK